MTDHLGKGRRRGRRPSLERLEDRRLLAYASSDVMTISEGAAAGAGAFRTQLVRQISGNDRVFIAWEEDAGLGTGSDVYARWYDDGGVPLGDAFRLNDEVAGDQASPRVEMWAGSQVIVAWWSEAGIEYRRYQADGQEAAAPALLAGTAGLSRDFELFGTEGGGISIYAAGFQVRRYDLSGALESSLSLAPAEAGWTAVESDAADRAEYSQGVTALTWSEVRPDPGGQGYDSRVVVGYFDAGARRHVVKTYEDRDESFADGLDPRFLRSVSMLAWVGDSPAGGRWIEESEFAIGSHPSSAGDLGEWLPGESPDGTPTAIAADAPTTTATDERIYIHSTSPGATDGVESDFRVWRHVYIPPPGWPRYSGLPGIWYWAAGDRIPTPDIPPEAIGSLRVVPIGDEELWLVWNGPAGGLHAQRFFSDFVQVWRTNFVPGAGEAEGAATVELARSGDVSRPLTIRYRAFVEADQPTSPGPALPGYDFIPSEGEVTFEAGSATATFAVPILDDGAADGDKTFLVELSDPAGLVTSLAGRFAVQIVDDEPAELAPTTFFDYGDAGLWSFNEVAGWKHLNDLAPRSMIASPAGTVFLDYGDAGLWSWDGVRGWRKLNDLAPEAMAYGASERLILDYGAAGLWTLHDFEGWAHSNPGDPLKIAADSYGFLVDFGAPGVWAWDEASGYRQVSLASPEGMAVYREQYYFDFGPGGLWYASFSSFPIRLDWEQVSHVDPESIAVAPDSGDLYVDFGPSGFWRWNTSRRFERLIHYVPGEFALGTGRVYSDFPGWGVWQFSEPTGFQVLSPYQAVAMALGSGDDVILDFGRGGVWRWSPTAGWRKLNDLSPRAMVRT